VGAAEILLEAETLAEFPDIVSQIIRVPGLFSAEGHEWLVVLPGAAQDLGEVRGDRDDAEVLRFRLPNRQAETLQVDVRPLKATDLLAAKASEGAEGDGDFERRARASARRRSRSLDREEPRRLPLLALRADLRRGVRRDLVEEDGVLEELVDRRPVAVPCPGVLRVLIEKGRHVDRPQLRKPEDRRRGRGTAPGGVAES